MYSKNIIVTLLAAVLLTVPAITVSSANAQQFSLLFTNNLQGEYLPCG